MEIYQMAPSGMPWDIRGMAARVGKKAGAEKRARAYYARLMALQPEGLSQNDWCKKAGVSTSFFTNMRSGSEPSIGNLRDVVEAIGLTLPEFFAEEARGRLVPALSEQALVELIDRLLPRLPRVEPDRRSEYLASALLGALALPATTRASGANDYSPSEGVPEEVSLSPAPTRRAGSARRRS